MQKIILSNEEVISSANCLVAEKISRLTLSPTNMMKRFLKDNRLLLSVLAGVVLGIVVGVSAYDAVQSSTNPSSPRLAMYVKFPGELFIRMLKMIVVPLVTSSIIVALTDSEKSLAGQLGKRTMVYYVSTTVFASILGLVLGLTISPGSGMADDTSTSGTKHTNSVDSFLDLLRNCFPDNIIQAMFHSTYTIYEETPVLYSFVFKPTNTTSNMSASEMFNFLENNLVIPESLSDTKAGLTIINHDVTQVFKGVAKGGGPNIVGLVVFSIVFGIVLKMIEEEGEPLVAFFKSLWSATMKLVEIIMWTSPIGIGSIVAGNILESNNILVIFEAMGKYVLTYVTGIAIMSCVFYPGLYIIFTRGNPLRHIKSVLPALITAFGTASSVATLPTTIDCCESKAKIDKRVTRFVLPVGATCNMEGAALFFAVIAVFIDQMDPTATLDYAGTVLTVVIATLVSIGAAAIPSPGLTSAVIVLETVGLPVEKLGPVLAVDWFMYRIGTTINVMGNTYAAAIIAKLCHAQLTEEDREEVKRCEIVANEKSLEAQTDL